MTPSPKIAVWLAKVPEHVAALAERFESNEYAVDGTALKLYRALDKSTGMTWKRIDIAGDGTIKCYSSTSPALHNPDKTYPAPEAPEQAAKPAPAPVLIPTAVVPRKPRRADPDPVPIEIVDETTSPIDVA